MKESKELTQFGKRFLLAFTTEMVRKHGGADFYRLKKIIEKETSVKEKIEDYKKKKSKDSEGSIEDELEKEKKTREIKKLLKEKKSESSPEAVKQRLSEPKQKSQKRRGQVLRVPQTKLPRQFKNIRPQANKKEIELGKIDDLANDPNVKEIECRGPGEKIYVRGSMGYQPTQITLNENEVEEILNKFSNKSQIPLMEGEYHVAVGNLTITANIQEERGKSNFVIKKIPKTPSPRSQGSPPGRRGRSMPAPPPRP